MTEKEKVVKGEIRNERSRAVQGQRAGFASQALSAVLDALVILAIYFAVLAVFAFLRFLFTSHPFEFPKPSALVNSDLVWLVGLFLLTTAWAGSGRAPGMAVVGLRVVTDSGERLTTTRAFWRALFVVTTVGLGIIFVLFSRRNRSLYDMVCRTSVVYDWRPRLVETRPDK